MGWKFYSLDSLPAPYSVVWCKWPRKRLEPGVVRPVLVRKAAILEDQRTKTQYGAVTVSFATGDLFKDTRGEIDLIVDDWDEVRALGLHKLTRFSCDPEDRRVLPWSDEYFVAQDYVRGLSLVMGALNEEQIARLHACLAKRAGKTQGP